MKAYNRVIIEVSQQSNCGTRVNSKLELLINPLNVSYYAHIGEGTAEMKVVDYLTFACEEKVLIPIDIYTIANETALSAEEVAAAIVKCVAIGIFKPINSFFYQHLFDRNTLNLFKMNITSGELSDLRRTHALSYLQRLELPRQGATHEWRL